MINTALVQVRVDEALKDEVTDIYNHYGLDLPTAIRIFFKKSVAVGGLPFDLREENTRWKIYDQVRKSIQDNNVSEMSLEEINAEIAETRKQAFHK
ncbi:MULTISPECIES: type II toxin-antitoxin system RelB/DinJ family antitoxin [Treponema]|uniref:type II toxin-antitoxin system RelB/DinJ family antitoxin n=1 Tax=Treponema TaxID=157 RepID=UPI00165235E9|nr:type II toxin-antitoxin system RelB/DinJ family antitoxin [Treponema sp. Marseille-Q4130]MBC6720689.1 type II toxin-antitoxin system RelB/DinJ family antitoxin [Treponema sp. Marseille-Q4130]